MALAKPPVVYDSVSKRHREAIEGAEVIGGKYIQLGDGLEANADGSLSVALDDLISTDSGNQLVTGADRKLYVPPVDLPEVDAAALVSTQSGNDLIVGSDEKLYANVMDGLDIDANDKILSKDVNGLLATVRLAYTAATGTIRLLGRGNVLLGSVSLPENQILSAAELVENPDDLDPGTYIHFTFDTTSGPSDMYLDVTKLVDVYAAADSSIDISGYAVKVNIDANSALVAGSSGLTIKLSKMVSSDTGNRLGIGTDNKFAVKRDVMFVDTIDSIPDGLASDGLLVHIAS